MFKQKHRLTKTKDITAVHTKGKRYFSPFVLIKSVKNGLGYPRFTVMVSTKVHKSAVKRNRLKRVVRELVSQHLPAINGYDVIIIPSRRSFDEKGAVQKAELDSALKKGFSVLKITE